MKKPTKKISVKKKGKVKPTIQECFKRALLNISHFGDTDIFPYPIENKVLLHDEAETIKLLCAIDGQFEKYIGEMPPTHDRELASVGYAGFRAGTQIDPIWNAYLLGLVIYLGEEIERARVDSEKDIVHSYRFNKDPEEKGLFKKEYGWGSFHRTANEQAANYDYVVVTDISDFYPRIYHHRLENALKKCTNESDKVKNILEMITGMSVGNVSYGLPVGGPAARILSELVLNNVDRLLVANGIKFCRFVDDFRIFANTREEAFGHLVFLAQKLLDNEGLLLQKNKTRIMSSKEYLTTSALPSELDEDEEQEVKSFLSVNLHFDPYSDSGIEDYDNLKNEISKFDISGMLSREIHKTRIHESLTKQLLRAIRLIDDRQKNAAIETLCENIGLLAPLFPTVIIIMISLLEELDATTKQKCFGVVRALIGSGSHITLVPINLAYAVRLLALDNSDESDAVLISSYNNTESIAVKHHVILALAKHDSGYWISDRRRQYSVLTPWERRAIIIASYILGDEGSHWRRSAKSGFSEFDQLLVKWASSQNTPAKLRELL